MQDALAPLSAANGVTPPADLAATRGGAGAAKTTCVVGGGLLGMVLALRLAQRGNEVTLLESEGSSGGLAADQSIGGYSWDRFYHVILLSDQNTRALLDELGLSDRLRWGQTKTGFYTDGKLYSMSDALEFLRFPPLSLLQKLRLGATIMIGSRITDWRPLEKVLAVDWLRRFSGTRVVEKIWMPLLKSKLGDNARIASAAFIWAIIARMYAARRSGLKREMFGYIDGGYAVVIGALQRKLDAAGVKTLRGARVASIASSAGGVQVALENGSAFSFDRLVSTLPTPTFDAVCKGLSQAERQRHASVIYQGIICPSVLLRQPLSRYYVTNITDRWVPFTGVIEMTALVDRERFGGQSLVYLPIYLPQHAPEWSRSDDEIRESCLMALEKMYPHFRRDQVVDFRVARARNVLAISTLNYSATAMPAMKTSLPHIYQLTSAQIANGTLNVNETLGLMRQHFDLLFEAMTDHVATA